MVSHNDPAKRHHLEMLGCLAGQKDRERKELMQNLYLIIRSVDLAPVSRTLQAVNDVGDHGFQACKALILQFRENREIASVRLAIWLRSPQIERNTEDALFSLGKLVTGTEIQPTKSALQIPRKYHFQRVIWMVEMSQQLEKTRTVFQRKDPERIEVMMDELGLENSRGVGAVMADLPAQLVSFVEATVDDHIELSFPLTDPEVNAMQRLGFGLSGTETLLVCLRVTDAIYIDGFCCHVNEVDSGDDIDKQHMFYDADTSPVRSYCYGSPNRLTYLVSAALWRMMQTEPDHPISMWYELVATVIKSSGRRCIVCGTGGSAGLHRPVVCNSKDCQTLYLSSDLETRLQDLRTDGRAVDLHLTSVFATAASGDLALLPNRPDSLSDPQKLINLLNSLPASNQIASAPDTGKRIRRHGWRAKWLLSWACTSYRGFFVTAQGKYRIPNMPNVHQFLHVDANPEVESRFAQYNASQPRTILFHGTSLDRLYAILAQGLRVLSNTQWMKHGAAQGAGVYLRTDPSVAWGVAAGMVSPHSNYNGTAFFKSRSDFNNAAVVLGCEHVGNDGSARARVHVITDVSRLTVRYVFVFQPATRAPRAQDITGSMLSTINYLRSTAASIL